jgi:hypothetical protein
MRNQKDQGVVSSLIIFGLLIMIILATCSGCASTVPVTPKWPDVPKELLESCPDLKTVDPTNDKLSAIVDTVADNYQEYYKCKDNTDSWIMWYKGQQEIWKTLK